MHGHLNVNHETLEHACHEIRFWLTVLHPTLILKKYCCVIEKRYKKIKE